MWSEKRGACHQCEPDDRVTSYIYDKAGNRLTQSVVSDSSKTDITYKFDERNRLTKTVEERDGNKVTTSYSYDENGNQTKLSAMPLLKGNVYRMQTGWMQWDQLESPVLLLMVGVIEDDF